MSWPFRNGPIGAWLARRRVFRELKQFAANEAATLSLDDANPLHRAKVSVDAGDLESACKYLAIARERIPDYVRTSPETVDVLLALGEFADLDALMLAGAKRFPNQRHYLEGYAKSAQRRRDFDEAIKRWAAVRKRFPSSRWGYIGAAGCLRDLNRLDEAEALVQFALRTMPDDLVLLLESAHIAQARKMWDEAYRRWDSLRERHPQGFVGAALALNELGRADEAEALLANGRFRYPTYPQIATTQAHIAEVTGNTAEALRRWAVVRERFPLERFGYEGAIKLLRKQQEWAKADEIAEQAIRRFPAGDWPLAEYANIARERRDWPEAAKRWAAVLAAFPNKQYAASLQAEAIRMAVLQPEGAAQPGTSPPPCSG